ncbi:MAG: tetratricopeptide repeat protein [Bacteroides sp.]
MGFFKSFFSGKAENAADEKQKNDQKRFEIFKYDGMRAQRMGRSDYAIQCFVEALQLQEDFETMGYLAQTYIQTGKLDEARELLQRMTQAEPEHVPTLLTLANVCYMQEDYPAMAEAAQQAIRIEAGNAMGHYLLGKAENGQGNGLMCVAHLTKAIVLKDDFIEARLLRAEALIQMRQFKEAEEDIEAVLAHNPEEESALLLQGKLKESTGAPDEAAKCYRIITELNPFNEQAYLALGQLYITQKKLPEAIALFDEAIDLNPEFAAAYHERGRAKLLNGDKEGSMEDMKKGLELNPKEGEHFNGEYSNQPGGRQTDILGL